MHLTLKQKQGSKLVFSVKSAPPGYMKSAPPGYMMHMSGTTCTWCIPVLLYSKQQAVICMSIIKGLNIPPQGIGA